MSRNSQRKKDPRKGKCPGSGKRAYHSRIEAWNNALEFYQRTFLLQTCYRCWLCRKFHLTSRSEQFVPPLGLIERFEAISEEWEHVAHSYALRMRIKRN